MKNTKLPLQVLWFALLVFSGLATRWVPHAPNFTALLAVALFAPVVLPVAWAFAVPVFSAALGDLFLGFHDLSLLVYSTLILIAAIGHYRKPQENAGYKVRSTAGLGNSFLASVLFFFVTNFGVWALSGMYALNGQGLYECFLAAVPFFNNTLISTFLFVFAFEGVKHFLPQGESQTSNVTA